MLPGELPCIVDIDSTFVLLNLPPEFVTNIYEILFRMCPIDTVTLLKQI